MHNIKKVYLYVVSLISLVILVIAAIMLLNMGLKAWVFTKADSNNYYYPPKIACDLPANANDSVARAPECSNPNYEQKMQEADRNQRSAQRQRDAAQALAMIIVATPIFLYHWKLARKEA